MGDVGQHNNNHRQRFYSGDDVARATKEKKLDHYGFTIPKYRRKIYKSTKKMKQTKINF